MTNVGSLLEESQKERLGSVMLGRMVRLGMISKFSYSLLIFSLLIYERDPKP